MDQRVIDEFNRYLEKVRDYHRRAQTRQGLVEVSRHLGIFELPYTAQNRMWSFNDALLEAIALKVIPDRFQWHLAGIIGTVAEIILIGVVPEDEPESSDDLNNTRTS